LPLRVVVTKHYNSPLARLAVICAPTSLGSWEVTLFKSLEGLIGWVSGSGGNDRVDDPTPSADVLARAEGGDAEAANELGLWYSEIQPDSRKAELWFRRAADAGMARAQYNMGVLTKNLGRTAESVQWLRQAVAGGWPSAPFALGSLLEEQGDRKGAFAAFDSGARQGCPLSQDAIGHLSFEYETEESFRVARYWSEKSAEQGYAPAQARMGTIFHEGLGVERDPQRAAWWFLQAAQQGHAGAQAMIGAAYHLGVGVTVNRFDAMRWLMLSAAQGNAMAKGFLPEVNAELTPEERSALEQWIADVQRNKSAR
jgi:TPR repeat protein